jgi:hypothetical protein
LQLRAFALSFIWLFCVQVFSCELSSVANLWLALLSSDFGLFLLTFRWNSLLILSLYTEVVSWREYNKNFISIFTWLTYTNTTMNRWRWRNFRLWHCSSFFAIVSLLTSLNFSFLFLKLWFHFISMAFRFISLRFLVIHSHTYTMTKNTEQHEETCFEN